MRINSKNDIQKNNWISDILVGIIIALVSIPISMGYAGIAGLPPVYGLYGSLVPILVFSIVTTSPQFVVGVDAMPSVMAGGVLISLGFTSQTQDALKVIPLLTFFVAVWFIIFFFIKAGRIIKYISTPVMGGFISGVGFTIILMQIPKLFGADGGTGEAYKLIKHIFGEFPKFNMLSFVLSVITIAVILLGKRFCPKFPMVIVMLVFGAVTQLLFNVNQYGVPLLPEVTQSSISFSLPDFSYFIQNPKIFILESFSIAVVIMAQTLLVTNNYALKYNYKINAKREIIAYSCMNFASSLIGCPPINGSVSRSGMADSLGVKSQIMSISASITMLFVILLGTPFLKYLPVPVLTAIVMTALLGILDIKLAKKLLKTSINEFFIFMVAFISVLLLGTVDGVIVGIILAFADVAIGAVAPPTSFVGRIPGEGNYFVLERNSKARPIKHVIIYRFSGNLFFANIDKFQNDIENAIKEDTKVVVVDARGIGKIDVTASDRLIMIYNNLKKRHISFYITEHDGSLNDLLRDLGGEVLIESGAARRTISLALRDSGFHKPYELEDEAVILQAASDDSKLPEFEWAFGNDAHYKMQTLVDSAVDNIVFSSNPEKEAGQFLKGHGVDTNWGHIGLFDENEFLDKFEVKLEEEVNEGKLSQNKMDDIAKLIQRKRIEDEAHLLNLHPDARKMLQKRRESLREELKEQFPQAYEYIENLHNKKSE